jgi:hypothetical protein
VALCSHGSDSCGAKEGGRAITIASDAHTTDALANNFYEAMAMAEALRPTPRPSAGGLLDPLTVPGRRSAYGTTTAHQRC